MWSAEQDKLPETERRPCPEAPPGFESLVRASLGKKPVDDGSGDALLDKMKKGATIDEMLQEYNDEAFRKNDQENLSPNFAQRP
eukprot:CAMPEP_0183312016 /NCGR_PEP_ID=MMETSP0160_2-20130417/39882_1 /TAXON_ID=2839 ORGANISM="Odontella Sinensis, Strain Grunow 1884" /NCGR_SAMPLE_ID=MMETSP0160_2 /ASSEMBLY_ACC=CAM_ASM_000250 /LENGTH=83 /DNA_ID=CAMNT_0025476783 /DNA_START=86 /DNA_END=337 /DNA_ORIENTATION=+